MIDLNEGSFKAVAIQDNSFPLHGAGLRWAGAYILYILIVNCELTIDNCQLIF